MSSMAKTAREAMKAKAKRLGGDRPLEKVDSSTFIPPELLNADVKTGLRPVSRRAFKKGGKVTGKANEARADRKPRKAGGKTEATEFANAKVNRNVKAANELREGIKHVGGMKKGGAAKRKGRDEGGKVDEIAEFLKKDNTQAVAPKGPLTKEQAGVKTGGGSAAERAANAVAFDKEQQEYQRNQPQNRKSGGRAKKNDGGPMSGAQDMMSRAQKTAGVPASTLDSVPASSKFSHSMGMKKGGKAHEDVAEDKALIKKMVKPEARTGKAGGGRMPLKGHKYHGMSDAELRYIRKDAAEAAKNMRGMDDKAEGKYLDQINDASTVLGYRQRGGQKVTAPSKNDDTFMNKGGRTGRKTGGGVFTGPGYPGKIPGVVPGGRTARATGGKARGKGKTNINIVIAAGKTPGADAGLMPPGGMPKPPGGIPIPLGPQGGPPQGGAPMPMPMPMPMPPQGGAGGPPGMPPMARKAGGRITKVASSYKDMEAGSAGGEGRLQKTDIAKKHKGAPTFKKGGKVYRSYKDMDAGAASGLGRLEKTEIAARKA